MSSSLAAVTYGTYKVKRDEPKCRTQVTRALTFTSYETGGVPLTAAQFGLSRITHVDSVVLRAGHASGYAHVDPLIQTDGSLLVRLRAAAGTESSSGTGSAAVIAHLTVSGY